MAKYTDNVAIGGIATASTWDLSNTPSNAFDGNEDSLWHALSASDAWLQYELPEAMPIGKYWIRRRDQSPTQTPSNWIFRGSNDGVEWTDIGTVNGADFINNASLSFEHPNEIGYKYYRWYFPTVPYPMSINEVEMYRTIVPVPASVVYDVTGPEGNVRGEAAPLYIRPTIKQFFTSTNWPKMEKPLHPDDDFTGTVIDTNRWDYWGIRDGRDDKIEISDNTLHMSLLINGPETYLHMKHKATFTGDVDVQIDFLDYLLYWNSVSIGQLAFRVRSGADVNHYITLLRDGNNMNYMTWLYTGGGWTQVGAYPIQHEAGKLRLTRTGQTYKSYFWLNDSWYENSSAVSLYTGPLEVDFYINSAGTFPAVDVRFDNFKLNNGNYKYN